MLPFDKGQFFAVFAAYNQAIWPAQVIAYAGAWVALLLIGRKEPGAHRLVWSILAAMWAWTGVAYHAIYFADINPIARGFGAAFVLQAAMLAYFGARAALAFGSVAPHRSILGWGAIAYATVLYPAVGVLGGHVYPAAPTFGVTPCSLVIFTFGLLLLTKTQVPRTLLAIPLIWSVIGGSAAVLLGVTQDWLLPVFAAVVVLAELHRSRRRPPHAERSRVDGQPASRQASSSTRRTPASTSSGERSSR